MIQPAIPSPALTSSQHMAMMTGQPMQSTGNPVLDEIHAAHDNLSEPAKQALTIAAGSGGSQPQTPAPASAPLIRPAVPAGMTASASEAPSLLVARSIMPGQQQATPAQPATAPLVRPAVPSNPDAPPQAAQTPHQANLTRLTAPPPSDPSLMHTRANTGAPGAYQVHNPWLRGLAVAGDIAASAVAPGIAPLIPGTTAHHGFLVRQAQQAVNSDESQANEQANRAHLGTENSELEARADQERANADRIRHPLGAVKDEELLYDKAGTPIGYRDQQGKYYGPDDPDLPPGVKSVLAASKPTSPAPSYHQQVDGSLVALHYDPATGKTTSEVVYKGDPNVPTEVKQLEIGGKPHQVLLNSQTGATIKDLGETGEKPPTVNVNQGTWSIEEDAQGKPIKYNSKTGETRPVASGGVQKPGTAAKADALKEPAKSALNYADGYLQSGAHTGPGDEALQEKFFELAKPATGFRMSQPQMDMLQNSRSWMQSLGAKARHATVGTWFTDEQRKQIVDTMRDLAKAKGIESGGSQAYVSGGRTYNIPADQVSEFLKDHPQAKRQ